MQKIDENLNVLRQDENLKSLEIQKQVPNCKSSRRVRNKFDKNSAETLTNGRQRNLFDTLEPIF